MLQGGFKASPTVVSIASMQEIMQEINLFEFLQRGNKGNMSISGDEALVVNSMHHVVVGSDRFDVSF